jgi:tyrosine-protein kinase Etk/Wzc
MNQAPAPTFPRQTADILRSSPEEEMDLRLILGTVLAGRWLLIGITGLVLMMGVIYAWIATPIYEADALVQVEVNKGKNINAALGDLAELLDAEAPITAEIQILTSRMVIGKVVDNLKLDLVAEPRYFPLIGRPISRRFRAKVPGQVAHSLLGLRRYSWGGEKIEVTDFAVPDALRSKRFVIVAGDEGNYELLDSTGASLSPGKVGERLIVNSAGGPIQLFVQNLIAAHGAEFSLARLRRDDVVEGLTNRLKVAERGKQSGILALSLEGPNPRSLVTILDQAATVYQRQNVERKSAEAEQTLAFMDKQLPELKHKLDDSEGDLNRYRLQQGSADLTKETEIILQHSVELEQAKLLLQQKREESIRRFTPNHPVIQAMDAQLAQLEAEKNSVAKQVKTLPQTQQELLHLTRDVTVNTDLYTSLLNNSQSLQIVKAGTVGNVRIIDFAVLPDFPSKPRTSLIVSASLALGVLLGLVAVFVRYTLHSGVTDPEVVEHALGIPTYGSIPFTHEEAKISRDIRKGQKGELLALAFPKNVAVEALRSLRTSLHFAQLDAANNIVMLTGPSPDLGKSFVSVNLGAVLAQAGKRVVVLDCDLRRGHIHQYVGFERTPGLSDFVVGNADVSQIARETNVEGLFVIPTGTIPPNPAELLLNGRFGELLHQLSKQFDHVIIDTPPVLAVTDAAVIGRLAGTTLVVLRAGEHSLRMISDTIKRLQNAGVIVRGTLFNQVNASSGYKYGYNYGYYNYDYSQSSK